jgi:hypothetical protein
LSIEQVPVAAAIYDLGIAPVVVKMSVLSGLNFSLEE